MPMISALRPVIPRLCSLLVFPARWARTWQIDLSFHATHCLFNSRL